MGYTGEPMRKKTELQSGKKLIKIKAVMLKHDACTMYYMYRI